MNSKHPQIGDQVFFSARVPNASFDRTGSTRLVQGLGTVTAVPFNDGSAFRASYEVDVVGEGKASCVRAALTFPVPPGLLAKASAAA